MRPGTVISMSQTFDVIPHNKQDRRDEVQALSRGLNVIAELNRCNGLSVSDLSYRLELPRPTIARILMTLQSAGYVYACSADGLYRVAAKVRNLSHGYEPSPWLREIAQPVANRLSDDLAWPIMVARLERDLSPSANGRPRSRRLGSIPPRRRGSSRGSNSR